jgi:periplasmic protein TonB
VPGFQEGSPTDISNPLTMKLTLLEAIPLPISLARHMACWWQERRLKVPPGKKARLPIMDMRPWFRDLPEQILVCFVAPPKMSAMVNSYPAAVPDIWQDFAQNPFSWANSLLIHVFALTVILLPFVIQHLFSPAPVPRKLFRLTPLVIKFPQLQGHDQSTHGGGGGGVSSPARASRGALPQFARRQFTPPAVKIPNVPPALSMPVTLLGPPELKLPAMQLDMPWGDPHGVAGPPSGGPGLGGGIGDGIGTGVGPGKGPGTGPGLDGGCCEGVYSVGGGISAPVAIYSPDPAYSEEARKAKFMGIVMLWIVVDGQGNVRNVRVAKPLGLGLDEEAVKTVSTWRFKPALRQGVPVPVQLEVEVTFRLF